MVKRILIALVVVIVLIIGGCYLYHRYLVGDEAKIRSAFQDLGHYASKSGKGGTTKMVLKTNAVAYLFADPCSLEVGGTFLSGDYSREEITANAVRARSMFKRVTLSFYDLTVDLTAPDRAVTVFTARLTGETKTGNNISETREMRSELKKIDGKWLFSNFSVVEVLKK